MSTKEHLLALLDPAIVVIDESWANVFSRKATTESYAAFMANKINMSIWFRASKFSAADQRARSLATRGAVLFVRETTPRKKDGNRDRRFKRTTRYDVISMDYENPDKRNRPKIESFQVSAAFAKMIFGPWKVVFEVAPK